MGRGLRYKKTGSAIELPSGYRSPLLEVGTRSKYTGAVLRKIRSASGKGQKRERARRLRQIERRNG